MLNHCNFEKVALRVVPHVNVRNASIIVTMLSNVTNIVILLLILILSCNVHKIGLFSSGTGDKRHIIKLHILCKKFSSEIPTVLTKEHAPTGSGVRLMGLQLTRDFEKI